MIVTTWPTGIEQLGKMLQFQTFLPCRIHSLLHCQINRSNTYLTYYGSHCLLPHLNPFVQLFKPSELGSVPTCLYSRVPRNPPHGHNHLLSVQAILTSALMPALILSLFPYQLECLPSLFQLLLHPSRARESSMPSREFSYSTSPC